jgi:ABC-type multidrug transport system fused ATPase/permease subunit
VLKGGEMTLANSKPTPAGVGRRPHRWPGLSVSRITGFWGWTKLLVRWAGFVIGPVLALFTIAAIGELLVSLGGQYQATLVAAVLGRLANQGAASAGWLSALLPSQPGTAAVLLLAVIALMSLFRFLLRAIDALANSRMMASLQATLHDRLIRFGTQWYDRPGHDTGANMQIVNLAPVVQQSLTIFVKAPLVRAISVVTAFMLIFQGGVRELPNTPLWVALIGAFLLLGIPVLAWCLSQPVRRANESVVAEQKRLSTELLNSFSQPLAIQNLGGAGQRSARFRECVEALALARFRTGLRGDIAEQFKATVPYLLQALFLLYAVLVTVGSGSASSGAITAIVLILQLVPETVTSILSVIDIFAVVNEQWPMIASVGEILDMRPPEDGPNAVGWPEGVTGIALRRASFSYGPALPAVLNGVDQEFAPGVITAIAGRSGSGKSTILQLLTRLRQPTAGRIEVGSTDLNAIRLEEVRRHIAIVHQSPPFLTDTVRANFQLVAPHASDAEIEAACRKVGIWDVLVIKNSAAPLDQTMTYNGGGANDFSGGERHRLAIARGLLTRPSILLFDEPTTGSDAQSLEAVAEAIRRASRGIASILIDHNLDFLLGVADQVCVLADGYFVQAGNPRQLAEQPGPFRDLLKKWRDLAGGAQMTTTSYPLPAYAASAPGALSAVSLSPPADAATGRSGAVHLEDLRR